VGNSASEPRLARKWAPDRVQCICAAGKHGGTTLPGWFLGSSEQGQGLRQYCFWVFLLLSLHGKGRKQWKSSS